MALGIMARIMTQERRRHPRVTDHRATLKRYRGTDGVDCKEVLDVSADGLRIETNKAESPGARVQVQLKLDEDDPTRDLEGRVVWARQVEPYEVGIRLVLTGVDRSELP